ILVGLAAERNLSHVLAGECDVADIIQITSGGLHVLPAASGIEWMANLTSDQKRAFLEKMDALNGRYDILLVDTGAGISSNVTYFNLAAQTRVVIVTPEPTSLTDAYAVIKVLHRSYEQKAFEVVVNQVRDENQGLEVFRSLTAVADRFLDVRLGYLGHILQDPQLGKAVLRQTPLMKQAPHSPAAQCYGAIARRIANFAPPSSGNELGLFWRRMLDNALV
ncbi:MAG: flagellar synthesis regulator FleN, partial [Candidatus Sumerlaeota bacterium]